MKKNMNKKEVRTEIGRLASCLLLGPMDPVEVLDSAPADTYLTGILWPQGAAFTGTEDDLGGAEPMGGTEEMDMAVPGYRAQRPCSIGVTFAADSDATIVLGLGQTARYIPVIPSPSIPITKGENEIRTRKQWKRVLLGYTLRIPPPQESANWKTSEFLLTDGSVIKDEAIAVHIRHRKADSHFVWTVTLINALLEEENDNESRDTRCLFQSEIIVTASKPDGSSAIRSRFQVPVSEDDEDALTNALLYRNEHEFAVGHGVAAIWVEEGTKTTQCVGTSWLPEASVKSTDPNGSKMLNTVTDLYPDMFKASFLARENDRDEVLKALDAFVQCYATWITIQLQGNVSQFEGTYRKAAEANLARCNATLGRIKDGVETLRKVDSAWIAFTMANFAMNRQSLFPSKGDRRRPLTWRPFQLAFMLLVIPGIVNPVRDDRQCMDLLWFPTGGGKTEAYLGIAAFQIFHRRLISADRRDNGGVDVLMRYTLRLLTVQQFQRAAALISACDMMRAEDNRLGTANITLGLYVGGEATPNRMNDARKALREEQAGENPKSTPRQLLCCPVCGSELQSNSYHADLIVAKVDITCNSAACETHAAPLPVLTVDEAIYLNPPSLLIGTIDKFAQIPRRTNVRRLFGMDGALRPGLIIQDELHLISGPLGSMAGLYETVVDLLCTQDKVRPKIIGSTATIGQAARQVKALFDRSVLQFPPPGFDATDSFFAVRDETGDDRLYIGISTAGRSPKFVLQATVATLLQVAEEIRSRGIAKDSDIDPYWTCVAYFNSLRELGGAYVLMQDDVPRQMHFLATRLGAKRRELELQPKELSSRVPSRELPAVLQSLETSLKGDDDPYAERPKDTVLASNMISVGVDVPRLGMMVVNGQPKSTAEYIQASSRVGRGMPGLVFTLYNFGRPRDLSHFEHFRGYHAALYRRVEATSVTPWASRARDKALHAVIIGAIRHLVSGMSGDGDAVHFNRAAPEVLAILESIRTRIDAGTNGVETRDAMEQIDDIIDQWARRGAEGRAIGIRLNYWEKKAPFGKTAPHLMCSAEEEGRGHGGLAWPTPNTMREVEPSTAFVFKRIEKKGGKNHGNGQ